MSLVRKLKSKLKSFIPYQDLPHFDAVFADGWKQYRIANRDQIESRFADLLQGMDDTSVEIAKTVFQRYTELAPPLDQDAAIRFVPDKLFTEYEKALQTTFSGKMAALDKTKTRLPDGFYYGISVFACDNGLAFLPPESIQRLRGGDIIDGGSFVGDSALVFSKYQPRRIDCFEPSAENRRNLAVTVSLNGLTNVSVVPAGLGGSNGTINLVFDASKSHAVDIGGTQVQLTTIDSYCQDKKTKPSLIKLDIEGAEYDAMVGAEETIRTYKPILIISVYHTAKDFFEIKPLVKSFNPNYRFMMRRLDPFHATNETVLIAY